MGRMDELLLEAFIQQRLELSPGPVTHFEWHGGEPTLADSNSSVTRWISNAVTPRPDARSPTDCKPTDSCSIQSGPTSWLGRTSPSGLAWTALSLRQRQKMQEVLSAVKAQTVIYDESIAPGVDYSK
jgi:hypothetical protein